MYDIFKFKNQALDVQNAVDQQACMLLFIYSSVTELRNSCSATDY